MGNDCYDTPRTIPYSCLCHVHARLAICHPGFAALALPALKYLSLFNNPASEEAKEAVLEARAGLDPWA